MNGLIRFQEAQWPPNASPQNGVVPIQPTADFPIPGHPFPGSNTGSRDNAVKSAGASNDRCHMAYAVRLLTSDAGVSATKELYMNTFVFSHYDPQMRAQDIDFSHFRNIHMFNAHLMSEGGRIEYGDHKSCAKLVKDWAPLGFQVTNTDADLMKIRTEAVITVAVSHLARVPNVWLALGQRLEVGDHLYWILRRHKLALTGTKTKIKTYWRWEPYISRNRQPPPKELWVPLDEYGQPEWIGSFLFVGQVNEFYGAQDPDRFQGMAKRAMFPNLDDDYKSLLALLPVVGLFYLVH